MKKLLSYILLLTVIFSAVLGINQVFAVTPSNTSPLPSADINGKVAVLSDMDILKGNAAGDLRLDSMLSRAEAVTLVLRLTGRENMLPAKSDVFVDVPQSHWAANNINTAYDLKYVTGVSFNQFGPDRAVSANEFCTMLMRALVPNAEVTIGNAFRYYAAYTGSDLMSAKAITERVNFLRRDMVDMLYSAAIRSFTTAALSPVLQNETYTGYESSVTLQHTPRTGYSWSYSVSGAGLLEKTNETTENVIAALGTPQNTTYTFKALKPGTAEITFTLKSSAGEVAETRKYKLIINDLDELKELTRSERIPLGETRVIRLDTNTQPGYVWSYWIHDTLGAQSTATPTPSAPSVWSTLAPVPVQSVDGGYLANCVLMREVPGDAGKSVQEFIVKTYLYGTVRLNFYYMAANSGITSTTNPFHSITIAIT